MLRFPRNATMARPTYCIRPAPNFALTDWPRLELGCGPAKNYSVCVQRPTRVTGQSQLRTSHEQTNERTNA